MRPELMRTRIVAVAGIVLFSCLLPSLWSRAESSSKATSPNPVKSLVAIGNASASSTTGCTGIACPTNDACVLYSMVGTLQGFSRFGPALQNANVMICISQDTTTPQPNGNALSDCYSSSGVMSLTGKPGATVSIGFAGETCTIPGQSTENVEVVNTAFAVIDSTVKMVSRGSGSFTAFLNTATGDATFSLSGNYSK
jgi:hypothetical protein